MQLIIIAGLILVSLLLSSGVSCSANDYKKLFYNTIKEDSSGFYSSSRDKTSLGPTVKYPKTQHENSSSSQRLFTGGQVNNVPFMSPAESLEIVPGLAVGR